MENKYMVAKSYQSAERIGKPFEKNGKLYQKIKEKCPRCGGLGIIVARVENGQPIPIPVDQGICYQCAGDRYIYNEVRLYTQQEYKRMERVNENAKAKRMAEQEQKMKAEFEVTRKKWLAENGWSENEVTYVVSGDSYSIKEELKEAGFRYDPVMKWHKAKFDENYADRLVEFKFDEVGEISAWGKGSYNIGAKDYVNDKIAGPQVKSTSRWIGEVGEKIKDVKVQLIRKYSFETKYGYTTLFSFVDENQNVINWFTSTIQEVEPNNWCKIKCATIKKLDEYKGVQQTVITRAKLAPAD